MLVTPLGKIQCVSEELAHLDRERDQVPFAATDPDEWLFCGCPNYIIPKMVWPQAMEQADSLWVVIWTDWCSVRRFMET